MKAKLILGLICSAFLMLTACSKDDPGPGDITSVSHEDEETIRNLEYELSLHSVEYDESYQRFEKREKLVSHACDEKFLKDIYGSLQLTRNLIKKLAPKEALYREKALDFFRKIGKMEKSLSEIHEPLNKYCEKNHRAFTTCIQENSSIMDEEEFPVIYFWINNRIGGYDLAHPMFKPNNKSDLSITMNTQSGDFRAIDTKTGEQARSHPVQALVGKTSEAQLMKINSCFNKIKSQSPISDILKKAAQKSFSEVEAYCNERGYSHERRDFCTPDPLEELPENSIVNGEEFRKYYTGIDILAGQMKLIADQLKTNHWIIRSYERNIEPKDPESPFAFLDEIDGETPEQRVARIKKSASEQLSNEVLKLKILVDSTIALLQQFPIIKGKALFRPVVVASGYVSMNGPTYKDITDDRLIELTRRQTSNDGRVEIFSKLFHLKRGVSNIKGFDFKVELRDHSSKLDVPESELAPIYESIDKIIADLFIKAHPKSLLGNHPDKHEDIIKRILDYDPSK